MIITIDGNINPKDPKTAPGTPAVVNPTYVDIFTPMAPGVDSETAIISATS